MDVAEIFKCKVEFKRNSKTKGAMREPLRTLTSQATMNKFIGTDLDGAMPRAQDLDYKKVGDKYQCPYCFIEFKAPQGPNKAYKRHLTTKKCQMKRGESVVASGGVGAEEEGSSDEHLDDTIITGVNDPSDASADADVTSDNSPSKSKVIFIHPTSLLRE